MAAVIAGINVATERSGATGDQGTNDLRLRRGEWG